MNVSPDEVSNGGGSAARRIGCVATLDETSDVAAGGKKAALAWENAMAVSFTTCPYEVTAGKGGGIVIEDRKTGQSWRLTNRESREFVRLIGRQRRTAEHLAENAFGQTARIQLQR